MNENEMYVEVKVAALGIEAGKEIMTDVNESWEGVECVYRFPFACRLFHPWAVVRRPV